MQGVFKRYVSVSNTFTHIECVYAYVYIYSIYACVLIYTQR